MNYPIALAGAIVFLAFLAHVFIGNREAFSTRPKSALADDAKAAEIIDRHWVQSLCAFQLVSIDLFVMAVFLLLLGITDVLSPRRELALAASGFFALWGAIWLGQLLVLRRRIGDYLMLGQWACWFVCAGLLWWGARALER